MENGGKCIAAKAIMANNNIMLRNHCNDEVNKVLLEKTINKVINEQCTKHPHGSRKYIECASTMRHEA